MSTFGKLYLLPVPISDLDAGHYIPSYNIELIQSLKYFITENAKTARKFLKYFHYNTISTAQIEEYNQHTSLNEIENFLKPLLLGINVGLMSDAGCPGIADPGAELITLAHRKGIMVVPLAGPSSIVLSIMASGFNGQNFAFVGYLPVDKTQKIKRIKELEQIAIKNQQAQFFIETPYRSQQLFSSLVDCLGPSTKLFVGINITANNQEVVSKTVTDWRKMNKIIPDKTPVVFGIY